MFIELAAIRKQLNSNTLKGKIKIKELIIKSNTGIERIIIIILVFVQV